MLPCPVCWNNQEKNLCVLDQRLLPWEVSFIFCNTCEDVAQAIESLAVRGAPAIGVAAAYGVALGARNGKLEVERAIERLSRTRPTAVNLFWALDRMSQIAAGTEEEKLFSCLLNEAHAIREEDIAINRQIGTLGQSLLPRDGIVLTHCNAGSLATAGYGTALGVIRAAREHGKNIKVYADETRPVFQGARLTAWELLEEGFDVTVICDNMAGALMQKQAVAAVLVGADRIALNGDTANKIGTYSLAILARYHSVPFYVVAPTSTIDKEACEGSCIEIEERDGSEVREPAGHPLIPESFPVWNPAFDVTPHTLIQAIVTEKGVLTPPFLEKIIDI
jgi:methylthioribose-1-phosphate isomerase